MFILSIFVDMASSCVVPSVQRMVDAEEVWSSAIGLVHSSCKEADLSGW